MCQSNDELYVHYLKWLANSVVIYAVVFFTKCAFELCPFSENLLILTQITCLCLFLDLLTTKFLYVPKIYSLFIN